MDSRRGYLRNRCNLQATNECFLTPGTKAAAYKRISNNVPASRIGKPTNFFNIREQIPKLDQVPTKNERSTSFAVDESKVQRRQFGFNMHNILLREKAVSAFNKLQNEKKESVSPVKIQNRHFSRNNGCSHSIDFINHTEVRDARAASDGGFFTACELGRSATAAKRLGTAERGHGRQFLVTDFVKNQKNPHFNARYEKLNLGVFSMKRSEFSDISNAVGATKHVIRPSDHTFNQLRSRMQR